MAVQVCLEVGAKRVFAAAIDWPSWCRSGKTEELALEGLQSYRERYSAVLKRADVDPPADADLSLEVVERVPGNETTDFGAPAVVATVDRRPLDAQSAHRVVALLSAAWSELDAVIAGTPAEMRKGPRGGGRDRDVIAAHVLAAQVRYARKLGVSLGQPSVQDAEAIAALRQSIAEAITRSVAAVPAARCIAWHVIDHAWEIEAAAGDRRRGGDQGRCRARHRPRRRDRPSTDANR